MMKHPLVTVVMSVYNGERHLRASVDSVLAQTFSDFEFIIIDDGSTDRTRAVLDSYSDPRIRVYSQRNCGLAPSLNRGISLARGRFIARQDADDVSHPERFAREVAFLGGNREVGLVGTHVSFINDKGIEFGVWRPPQSHERIREEFFREGSGFCHGSVMVRKACLDEVGTYREKFRCAQDYDLWVRISERHRVANIGEILYQFRRWPGTISRKKLSRQLVYHLLVVALAEERRRCGFDRLDEIDAADIEAALQSMYGLSRQEIARFKAGMFMRYFRESMKSGNFGNALLFWSQSFFLAPAKYKIRTLVEECLRIP